MLNKYLFILALAPLAAFGQGKLSTDRGEISFTSNAPLEMIKASTNKVSGNIDPATNQFAFLVPITSFIGFNSDLQRQHFNDNYMESMKYPRASFSGKIIEQVDYSKDSTYSVRAKGDLDVHGQKQTRIIKGKLIVNRGTVRLEAEFIVPLTDHNIAIPKIVSQKIATEIDVNFRATLTRQ
jgi:hypothetical protein